MIRTAIFICICIWQILTTGHLLAQESLSLQSQDYYFPDGADYFKSDMYGLALHNYEILPVSDPVLKYRALSSYMIDEGRSISLLLESISRSTDPKEVIDLQFAIGDYYFSGHHFPEARDYYLEINDKNLNPDQYEALNFRLGYIYLTEKRFEEALGYFSKSKKYQGEYYIDAWYYSGICEYYLNRKEDAIASFEYVQNANEYRHLIPYYLAQIYFKEGDYEKAIAMAEKKINTGQLADESRLLKILGMSYLALEEHDKALPYLDAYARKAGKLTENEFYQIAITHYNLGQYEEATPFFKELSHQNSEIGQVSNYLLGSIYLNQDELKNGQAAFKQASKYSFYPDIRDESRFLYFKISADLGDSRVAMSGLSQISEENPYYTSSIDLLESLLERSDDHLVAMNIIEGMDQRSPRMMSIYKELAYRYGVQLLQEEQVSKAITYLETSQETPVESTLDNNISFWLGYAHDKAQNHDRSDIYLKSYLDSPGKDKVFKSYYLLAYHAIDDKEYDMARDYLEKAVAAYNVDQDEKLLFDDVVVRLADLELLNNNYESAIAYYDLAIDNEAEESDYILYQKALIYGVNGQSLEKLTHLEALLKEYPDSEYRDDALFEIGESLMALRKNNEAFQVYKSLVNEYGDASVYTPVSYLRQGLISYNQGDIDAALEFYKKGMDLTEDPDQKRQALLAIEEIYLNDRQDPEGYFAFTENEAGLELESYKKDSISYHIALASFRNGEYSRAVEAFKKYKEDFTNPFYLNDALYYQAESYALMKSYKDALYTYEQVLKNTDSPHYDEALRKAALIAYNSLKDFEKSHLLFAKWIDRREDVPLEVYESALYSAFVTGNSESILEYGSYIAGNKNATTSAQSIAHFYMAKVHQRNEDYTKAIEHYQKTVSLSDNNQAAEASFRISQIYLNQEMLEKAEEQAFVTTKEATNYPFWVAKSLILIGDIYTMRKDYLNASAAYESVIENFNENPEITEESNQKLEELNALIKADSNVRDDEELMIQKDSIK